MQKLSYSSPDRFIGSCNSWADFWLAAASLSEKQKGDVFERLVQLYLLTKPKYRTELSDVWLRSEVPADIQKRLDLPGTDEGIDLVVQTREGKFWAIQAKFKSDPEKAPTYKELSTFTNLAFVHCKHVDLALVAHTSTRPVRKRALLGNLTEIGLAEWLTTTEEDWALIHQQLRGKAPRPKPRTPRPHQTEAIAAASKHYIDGQARLGRLIMPCGTGKSLTAFWIAEALKAQTIAIIVPSLALIKQGIEDWTREFVALDETPLPEWLCVCSDESAGALEQDEFVGQVYDLGVPTTTNTRDIAEFLKRKTFARRMLFVTYQSSERLAEAARECGFIFDFAVLDEAHKTVGVKDKAFAAPLFDDSLPISKRLFMTATERVVRGRNDDVVSMNDEAIYGPCFHQLSFKDAINAKPPIISDYKILTYVVTDEEVAEFIRDNRLLTDSDAQVEEQESAFVAAGIALRRAFQKHGIKHAISFHRSIRSAARFADQEQGFTDTGIFEQPIESFHISSDKSAGERARLLFEFEHSACALMTNARCLTEGVDVPAIDCVLFADPKQSHVDIVQAAGRALRPYEGKSYGYIMLPIIVPQGTDFEEFAETTEFRHVASVITALSTQDGRIAEEFRLKEFGRVPSGKIIEIDGSIALGAKVDLKVFSKAIETKLWERVGRANWRSFEEARAFVQSLNLDNHLGWVRYNKTGKRPPDIPSAPDTIYRNQGWKGWGDWLGTRNRGGNWRDFEDARAFARSLGLKSSAEWWEFIKYKSGQLPRDVPTNPHLAYKDAGWTSMGDWLGTGYVAANKRTYRPFEAAREYARQLRLKSRTEWQKVSKSAQLPPGIPANPWRTYANDGWQGMSDWLGSDYIHPRDRKHRPFPEAREYARGLGLSSKTEWDAFCKSQKKPDDIPQSPGRVYRDKGWNGFGDWLGTGTLRPSDRVYRQFAQARNFVRSLRLSSQKEWLAYTKSGELPPDIPACPHQTYKDDGWNGLIDWLGAGRRRGGWPPFVEARNIARALGLNSNKEWREYIKSGRLWGQIPTNPDIAYRERGWVSWGDWLGTNRTWKKNS
jgi:superfamily II DNA or RNA helicase